MIALPVCNNGITVAFSLKSVFQAAHSNLVRLKNFPQAPQVARNRRTRAVDSSVTFNDVDVSNNNVNQQIQESANLNETSNSVETEAGINFDHCAHTQTSIQYPTCKDFVFIENIGYFKQTLES